MSDSEEEVLILWYLYNSIIPQQMKSVAERTEPVRARKKIFKKIQKSRKRPWLSERIEKSILVHGIGGMIKKELISEEENIVKNLNILPEDFYELLGLIKEDIEKKQTYWRNPYPPESRLSFTLKYINTGGFISSMCDNFCLGQSTACKIIWETCKALYTRLQPIVMPQPTVEALTESAARMKERGSFPNCVGVLDAKCVLSRKWAKLDKSKGRRDNEPCLLLGLTDARCCFLAVQVLPCGQSDVQALLPTLIDTMVPEDSFPPPTLLPQCGSFVPHVVLGSECLPLSKYLMTPYTLEDLLQKPEKGAYNKMHCDALEMAGYTFGLMAERFKYFQGNRTSDAKSIQTVTKACCVLHNFFRLKDLSRNKGTIDEGAVKRALENTVLEPLPPYAGPTSNIGREVRENFLTLVSSMSNSNLQQES